MKIVTGDLGNGITITPREGAMDEKLKKELTKKYNKRYPEEASESESLVARM